MGVNMADVARAANASIATVGRVLHNNGYVSEEARKRVEQAIADLGYIPDQNARSLKSKKSGIIGSLVLQNPNGLYYRINDSIQAAAYARGYDFLTMEVQPKARNEGRLIANFIGLHIDGLVITSNTEITREMFEMLAKAEIPVVAVERGYLENGVDSLITEDFEGCGDAVARIAEKGHRRIALVAMRPRHEVERQRLAGYLAAINDNGLSAEDALIKLTDSYSPSDGRAAAKELFSLENPPSAVFATADTLAAGVMQELYEKRLRVPDDISIVGYDDVLARSLSPAIDSVGLYLDDIGETVLELLTTRMKDPARTAERRTIRTAYMDRGTVQNL